MKVQLLNSIHEHGGRIYYVGGVVRDFLLGETSKDKDYVVTGIPMDDLIAILEQYGDANLVGKSFGVIKFKEHGAEQSVDVALPRKERSVGEGHRDFDVVYDHTMPLEEDLRRRDFTINAMAQEVGNEKELVDPWGGKKDLDKRLIRMVNPNAFTDDPLRMLRAVQFAARFKFRIADGYTWKALLHDAHLINSVSGERVFEEICKALTGAEFPSIAFKLMERSGLLQHVMPELQACVGMAQPAKYHRLDVFNHILHCVDSVPSTKLYVRMAALFHDIAKPQTMSRVGDAIHFYQHERKAKPIIESVLRRWMAPNDLIDKVTRLVSCHMFEATFDMTRRAVRRLIRRVGEDLIYDLVDLRTGDRLASGKPFLSMGKIGRFRELIAEELAEPMFSLKHLALDGNDLIALGLKPGPVFKKILNALLEYVMDEPTKNYKYILLEEAKRMAVEEGLL